MLNPKQIRRRLQTIAGNLNLHNAEIHVEKPGKWVHIQIIAPDFRGKSGGERENIIWRELERQFDDETILSITQCYLLTPEEREVPVPK
ncbi:MAG: hypothetical protein ABSE73_04610 [Planctomycetota bacterium]